MLKVKLNQIYYWSKIEALRYGYYMMILLSNTPQTDDAKQAAEKTAEIEGPLFSTRTRVLLISMIIISSLTAIFFTGWDIFNVSENQIIDSASRLSGAKGKVSKASKEKRPLPPVHPQHFFPSNLEGYTIFGRQKVPGEDNYAAEAIFKSEEEQFAGSEPISVYAKITYYGSDDAAQKAIDRDLSVRGAQDRINIAIGDVATGAGYTEDQSTLFVEWVKSGYAFQVSAGYVQATPIERTGGLEKNAVTVGKAIFSSMANSSK